jgi:hypothetical protein
MLESEAIQKINRFLIDKVILSVMFDYDRVTLTMRDGSAVEIFSGNGRSSPYINIYDCGVRILNMDF